MAINLVEDCELQTVSERQCISGFDCGNEDLNDFFNGILYQRAGTGGVQNKARRIFANEVSFL